MKKYISFIIAIMMAIFMFGGCRSTVTPEAPDKTDTANKESAQKDDPVMLSLAHAAPMRPEGVKDLQLKFGLQLLKKLGELEDGSLFYSPMSISAAMTMAYFGAAGETQREMADALGYGGMDMSQVASYQKYLLHSFENSGDTTFTSANSVWIDNLFTPKESYIDTMNDVFKTTTTKLDFRASEAVDILNGWIDQSTNGMIKELFDSNDNPFNDGPPTVMVLLNAIYFDGKWTQPFDPAATFDTDFNGATAISAVRMMSSDEAVKGMRGDDYISVSLPYGEDERFVMVAVLPDDMDAFIDGLTEESLSEVLSTFYEQPEAIVQIPVFEMEQKVKLNDALYALGIEKAFTESEADFSGMFEGDGLWIDEVLHKAKIKVDEEGTEAAAATSVEMVLRSAPLENKFEFIADRPFLFFIMDTATDSVLFTGKVLDLN